MAKPVYVLNGPNLNLLGKREPDIYGRETLEDVRERTAARAALHGLDIEFRQSNSEGELVDWAQEAREKASGLIVNAGAYTHTSVALLDALLAADIPCVEVHLSNLFKREEFRRHSFVTPAAAGLICGFGATGYELAIEALAGILGAERSKA